MDGEELVRVNQCRKLLLEAGGDPTLNLTNEGESVSYLGNSIATGTCVRNFSSKSTLTRTDKITGIIANCLEFRADWAYCKCHQLQNQWSVGVSSTLQESCVYYDY